MDIEVRALRGRDDLLAFMRADAVAFGVEYKEDLAELHESFLELDRTRAAFDADGRLVGASAALTWELTLPGGAQLPAAAVTWVGVMASHRRRGILTSMMGALLDDAVERREPLAVLLASESVIYGRFGYGAATFGTTYEIDRSHLRMVEPVGVPGRFHYLFGADAEPVVRSVYEAYRIAQVGETNRSDAWWHRWFLDLPQWRGGASPRFFVAHEREPGIWDGYATYRMHEKWDGHPDHTLEVQDLVALDEATRLALVEFLANVDLVSRLRFASGPVDEPLRWTLSDPRRLRSCATNDHLWVRVLDVERALSARTYAREGSLVLDVDDPFRPDAGGRFRLDVAGDGTASCERLAGEGIDGADVALRSPDLGSILLGGVSPSTLAAAGRAVELRPGAADRAAAMFVTPRPPHSQTDF